MRIHCYGQQLKTCLELISPRGGQGSRGPRIDLHLSYELDGEGGLEAGG